MTLRARLFFPNSFQKSLGHQNPQKAFEKGGGAYIAAMSGFGIFLFWGFI